MFVRGSTTALGARALAVAITMAGAAVIAAGCAAPRANTIGAGTAVGVLGLVPTVAPLDSSDNALLRRMTDSNVLEHLAACDSAAVVIATLGRADAAHDAVRREAGVLLTDHAASLDSDEAIARQEDLSITHTHGDSNGVALFRQLDSLRARARTPDFDRAFVAVEGATEQRLLAELDTLRFVARDPAVRRHVQNEIPVVGGHVDGIAALSSTLGYP